MKKVLIVGASRGIGLELCRQYLEKGDEVTGTVRQLNPEAQALSVSWVDGVDVTEDAGVEKLSQRLADQKFDLLIHNAGILKSDQFPGLELDAVAQQLLVNSVAPLRLVQGLLGHLNPGAKVGLMTSRMGSIKDNTSGGMYGYRMSKAALNAAGKSLSIDLKPQGYSVALLHPGWVKTDMGGPNAQITVEDSVTGLIRVMDQLELELTGRFWHTNGESLDW